MSKGILFCMRYPDDQGFVWLTAVREVDLAAGLLHEFAAHVAFPQLTGHSVHRIEHMSPVALDCYAMTHDNKEALRAFVKANDIVALVYMSALPSTLDMAFLRSLGVRTINTEQDSFDHRQRDPFPKRLAKLVIRRLLKRQIHDLHIANATSQGEWLRTYAKIPPRRLVIAPNGVDCGHFVPPRPPRQGERLNVVCVSQARREKRVDMILRCAARIVAQDEFAAVDFTYVGDGEMQAQWQQLARDLGLGERFTFAGAQSELLPFYQAADVMVHAAERESFGLVLAEAMACGLPVVATAAAGPAEIIDDGKTGRLVALDDEVGFLTALEDYLRDPALRRQHGDAARERAIARFSLQRKARQMAAAISKTLA